MYGTVHKLAFNGHIMEYPILSYREDGEPKLAQHDAQHSDQCTCARNQEEE